MMLSDEERKEIIKKHNGNEFSGIEFLCIDIERAVLAKASQQVQGEPVQSLDERMKAAGMLSVSQLLAGAPMDAFHKHAGVVDLDSLLEWVEMRRGECIRAQARYDLDKPKDDLYEWAIAHSAVFTELHVNLRAAIEGEKTKATPAPKQDPVASRRKDFMGKWVYRDEVISGNEPLYSAPPQAASIPGGWKLVPIEPTEEMIEGFWGEIKHGKEEIAAAKEAYFDMLAAAPSPDNKQ